MKRKMPQLRTTRRQRMSAWMLLLVYVPMVLLSSFHVHTLQNYSEVIECNLCSTSVHHQGHITASPQQHGECLSCRFLSTQVIVPDDAKETDNNQQYKELEYSLTTETFAVAVVQPSLRAPPYIL